MPEQADRDIAQIDVGPILATLGKTGGLDEASDALIASELRYRRLFESAQDGILILDGETGRIVDVNPFLIEMLGFSQEEVIGKKLWELGCFKDRDIPVWVISAYAMKGDEERARAAGCCE